MNTRPSFFVSTESQPRARRAADAVKVIGGAPLTGWGVVGADRQTPWERALTDVMTALPSWVDSILAFGFTLALLYGLGIVFAIITGGRRRRGALRDVVVAVLVGTALAGIIARAITGSWPSISHELGLDDPEPRFPVLRVVVVAAILVAASPHMSRPLRRLGWFIITVAALAAVGLGYGQPSDAVRSLGIGLVAGGAVLLVVGSPRGYRIRLWWPKLYGLIRRIEALGLELITLRRVRRSIVRNRCSAAPPHQRHGPSAQSCSRVGEHNAVV